MVPPISFKTVISRRMKRPEGVSFDEAIPDASDCPQGLLRNNSPLRSKLFLAMTTKEGFGTFL